MAPFTFALECPKCGTINTASKFLFAKKVIQCGTCGEEINVKQSRLVSKECPHCGKVFIYDQAKKEATCPHCNQKMQRYDAETVRYQMVTVNCPQCGCGVEANKTNTDFSCPLCGEHINIAKEYEKAQLVKDDTISVIQYEGDNSTFVWKHPIEDFNMGSQLIVHESQEAIFFMNGQALDLFGPGRHTLDTENLPVLKRLYDIPAGGQTLFHCEVYFINKAVQMEFKWGTPYKVRFLEPKFGIPVEIGAYGDIVLQVSDSRKLLVKLVDTMEGLSNKDVLSGTAVVKVVRNSGVENTTITKVLQSCFRVPLVTGIKSYLAQIIKEQNLNIYEIDEQLDTLSDALREKIAPRFEECGLTIPNFHVIAVVLPDDDKNFREAKERYNRERWSWDWNPMPPIPEPINRDMAIKRMQGEMEIDLQRMRGLGEADVMAAKGYTHKDELSTDVQKAYAEGIGKAGGRADSTGGTLVSEMISVVAGINVLENVSDQLDKVMKPAGAKTENEEQAEAWKCSCGQVNTTKWCGNCGAHKPWTCSCGTVNTMQSFCENCGRAKSREKLVSN